MNIHVDRHDKKGREEILKVHLKNIKTEENLDIDTLRQTNLFFAE